MLRHEVQVQDREQAKLGGLVAIAVFLDEKMEGHARAEAVQAAGLAAEAGGAVVDERILLEAHERDPPLDLDARAQAPAPGEIAGGAQAAVAVFVGQVEAEEAAAGVAPAPAGADASRRDAGVDGGAGHEAAVVVLEAAVAAA